MTSRRRRALRADPTPPLEWAFGLVAELAGEIRDLGAEDRAVVVDLVAALAARFGTRAPTAAARAAISTLDLFRLPAARPSPQSHRVATAVVELLDAQAELRAVDVATAARMERWLLEALLPTGGQS